MKKISAIVMMLIMALSLLTACSNGDTASTMPPASSDKPGTSDATKEDLPTEMGKLAIVFGGVAFSLPLTVEEFMALGWEPSNEKSAANLDMTLNPKERAFFGLIKGDYYALIDAVNLSESDAITVGKGTIIWGVTQRVD